MSEKTNNKVAMVTGDEVHAAMEQEGITYVEHHRCGICNEMVSYSREGDILLFHPGCGCSYRPPEVRSWESAAEWINMQTDEKWRKDIKSRFGMGSELGAHKEMMT